MDYYLLVLLLQQSAIDIHTDFSKYQIYLNTAKTGRFVKEEQSHV